jgi:N-acetylmuramoyl-L-alanine amidase
LSPDALIARQLQLSVFLNQSIKFADKLQKEFKRLGRYDRGVKQAGFMVLYKTTMPSVLIETGFLTNPAEEKFLRETDGQHKMAQAMFTAFDAYKNELEGIAVKSNAAAALPEQVGAHETPFEHHTTAMQQPDSISKQIVFRVQIETSEKKIPTTAEKFKGLDVYEYLQDNLYKYAVGSFINDFKGANNFKTQLKEKGYYHAFVVAFQNGQRINLEKAIKLAEK